MKRFSLIAVQRREKKVRRCWPISLRFFRRIDQRLYDLMRLRLVRQEHFSASLFCLHFVLLRLRSPRGPCFPCTPCVPWTVHGTRGTRGTRGKKSSGDSMILTAVSRRTEKISSDVLSSSLRPQRSLRFTSFVELSVDCTTPAFAGGRARTSFCPPFFCPLLLFLFSVAVPPGQTLCASSVLSNSRNSRPKAAISRLGNNS